MIVNHLMLSHEDHIVIVYFELLPSLRSQDLLIPATYYLGLFKG